MYSTSVFVFALLVCMAPLGANSLKCYYCSDIPGTEAIDCKAPKTKECAKDEDRCVKIKLKTNGTGFDAEHTAVNCSASAKCGEFCTNFKQKHADNVKSCSQECCQGELCNHPYNSTKPVEVGGSSTESPGTAGTGTASGTGGGTTTPAGPKGAGPSSLIQNVKGFVLFLAMMGLILVF